MRALHLTLLPLIFAAVPALALEQPRYEVVQTLPEFELRTYQAYAVAETTASGEAESAGDAAFRRLYGYISGGNRAQQKIEMTLPVVTRSAGAKIEATAAVAPPPAANAVVVMQFVLPSRFDADKAPQPADPEVRIRDVAAHSIAARRFSGRPNETNYRENEARLLKALQGAGFVPTEAPRLAVYNPPFTPPFMRRNEVLVPVERVR